MPLKAKLAAIEFAGDEVRLAVIKTGSKTPRVLELHSARAQYEEPQQRHDALVEAIKGMVASLKTKPTAYVLSLSSAYSIVRTITIPFKGARRVAPAVTFELERYLAIPIEDLVVDHLPITEIESTTEVLAIGVRRQIIQEQIGILNDAGIDPEGADLDAIGLSSLWKNSRPAVKGLHAALYITQDSAVFAVLYNKALASIRHITLSDAPLAERLDSLAQDVKNSIRAFHSGWKGEGEIAALDVIGVPQECEQDFAGLFELPVEFKDPLAKVAAPSGVDKALYAGLIGVAVGAVGSGFSLHLRKDELAHKNLLPNLMPHIMLTSCIALLLLVGVAWFYHHGTIVNAGKAAGLQQQIDALEAEVADLEAKGINVPSTMFTDPSVLDVLSEIAANFNKQQVDITDIKIEPATSSAPWVLVVGEVKDDNGFKASVEKIKQSPLFKAEEPELRLVEGQSTFRLVLRRPNEAPAGEETRS